MQPWSGPSNSLLNSSTPQGQEFCLSKLSPGSGEKPGTESCGWPTVNARGVLRWQRVPASVSPCWKFTAPFLYNTARWME